MVKTRLRLLGDAAVAAVLCAGFGVLAARFVPALRSDWIWRTPFEPWWRQVLFDLGGWNPVGGLGAPIAYPTDYLLLPALDTLRILFGAAPSFAIFMLAVAALIAGGASAIGRALHAPAALRWATMAFALFNPWVYAETVAGHTYMTLAYAATLWLTAEVVGGTSRPRVLVACMALALAQPQFFIVDACIVLVAAWRARCVWPAVFAGVLAVPAAIGVFADRPALSAIPYIESWQQAQSVSPLDAPLLVGYFAGYTSEFGGWGLTGPALAFACVVLALIAAAVKRTQPETLPAVAAATLLTIVALLVSFGTRGPFPDAYLWLVSHVRASALFRELYDLIGFVAIGYAVVVNAAGARVRALAIPWGLGAAGFIAVWIAAPPATWWVNRAAIPGITVTVPQHQRFALIPAFQPMQFEGHGSGLDPNWDPLGGGREPVNELFATYPVSAALASFQLDGRTEQLAGLGVAGVVVRPWLETDIGNLGPQLAFPADPLRRVAASSQRIAAPMPLLSLADPPHLASLANDLRADDVLFSDAADPKLRVMLGCAACEAAIPIAASTTFLRASDGWVSATFAFAVRPDLGEGLGGAITTSPAAAVPVRGGLDALVNVEGTLLGLETTGTRTLAHDTHGFRWIGVPAGVFALRCRGTCLAAAQAKLPAALPLSGPPATVDAAAFAQWLPWLLDAELPPRNDALVRYNVAYDPGWLAFAGRERLPHVRIDTAVNGWVIARHSTMQHVVILHWPSLLQFVAEACIVASLALYALAPALDRTRATGR